jgi:phenylpropionate dioxygenase-like ring-hydroxylating dioxygenase large terminal subunit
VRDLDNKVMIHGVARELLMLMASGSTHMESRPFVQRTQDYLDPDLFELEKRALFRKLPLVMAFTADMPSPGDWRVHDDTDVPVLIVRTKSGKVRAFLNACRHRGAKLTAAPCGNQKRFTCPYHAWTYDAEGRLIGVPAEGVFGDIDRKSLGLVEFPAEERAGMIFVVPEAGGDLDLDALLGEGGPDLAGWHFERNTFIGERDLVTPANWKLALDTYCENYHFQVLHAEAFGPYKVPNCAHHWRWGHRSRNWTLAWPSKSLESMRNVPEAEWGDIHDHFSMLHFIFPNTVIAMYPDSCTLMQPYPGKNVREQHTRMRYYSRTPNPTPEKAKMINARLETFYHVLQNEDYLMVETAFRSIQTGLLPEIIFGRNEPALAWLHESLDEAVRGNGAPMGAARAVDSAPASRAAVA